MVSRIVGRSSAIACRLSAAGRKYLTQCRGYSAAAAWTHAQDEGRVAARGPGL